MSSSTSTVGSVHTTATSPKSKSKSESGRGFLVRFFGKYMKTRKHPQPTIQSPILVEQPLQQQYNSSSCSSSMEKSSSSSSSSSSSELQQIFTYFDEDGDGKISASELQTCLRAVGSCDLSDEEAEKAVRTSDADGDGMLGFDDFSKLMEIADDDDKLKELREAFTMYSDDDIIGGYISPKSLKNMLTRLGQSTTTISSCKDMITKFDLNGDGLLNFHEFRIMML